MNVQPATAGLGAVNTAAETDIRAAGRKTASAGNAGGASTAEVSFINSSPTQGATRQPSRSEVESAVSQIKDFVSLSGREINFTVDEASGIRVVKVLDKSTDQVIRQIPSEEVVAIARALDKLQGLFVSDKV